MVTGTLAKRGFKVKVEDDLPSERTVNAATFLLDPVQFNVFVRKQILNIGVKIRTEKSFFKKENCGERAKINRAGHEIVGSLFQNIQK